MVWAACNSGVGCLWIRDALVVLRFPTRGSAVDVPGLQMMGILGCLILVVVAIIVIVVVQAVG